MPSPNRSPLLDGGESSAPRAAVSVRSRVQLRRWLPLLLGLAAVALGLYAQWLITSRGAIQEGVYWYLAAMVTLVVGWRGSERDRRFTSLVPEPTRTGIRKAPASVSVAASWW